MLELPVDPLERARLAQGAIFQEAPAEEEEEEGIDRRVETLTEKEPE